LDGLKIQKPRPDLYAYNLLEKLVSDSQKNIINYARDDTIHLSVDCEELAVVTNKEDILLLTRNGIYIGNDEVFSSRCAFSHNI
jgi:hypothetical protein